MAVITTNKTCLRKAKNQLEKHQMGFDGEHIGEVVLKRLGYKNIVLTSHKSKFDILTAREAWEIKTVGRDALDKKMSIKAKQKVEKLAWAKKNKKSPKSMMVIVNDSAEVYVRDGLGKFRPGGMKKVVTYKDWRKEVGHGRSSKAIISRMGSKDWYKDELVLNVEKDLMKTAGGGEAFYLVDGKTGKNIMKIKGGKDYVDIKDLPSAVKKSGSKSFISFHNHPNSASFGPDDLNSMIMEASLGGNHHIVFANDGAKYRLIFPYKYEHPGTMKKNWYIRKEALMDEYKPKVLSGKMTPLEAWKEHSHRIMEELSRLYGFEYERIL